VSFLVLRHLETLSSEFDKFLKEFLRTQGRFYSETSNIKSHNGKTLDLYELKSAPEVQDIELTMTEEIDFLFECLDITNEVRKWARKLFFEKKI
jgi:hypothetical protein